ncbi:MAG TPA: polysaccharide deacetylase family protein [Vicinamibacterales bacterium]|nr:polysaccharide deacetylase family protein [Vicinamibacterales bacterium]
MTQSAATSRRPDRIRRVPTETWIHVCHDGNGESAVAGAEPLTIGVPFPRGVCPEAAALRLWSEGAPIPLQTAVLDRWPDGSIRWALLDFQAAGRTPLDALRLTWSGGPEAAGPAVSVDTLDDGAIRVNTGVGRFTVACGPAFPFRSAEIGDAAAFATGSSRFSFQDARGRTHAFRVDHITVEEAGPLRTVVCARGTIARGRRVLLEGDARLHFFAGSPVVRIALTVRNPRPARHRGGFWELGDRGSVLFDDATVSLPLGPRAQPARLFCSHECGLPLTAVPGPLEVYQDSSGGANWASTNHVNRAGKVPHRFRGYRSVDGLGATTGLRATPLLVAQHDNGWAAIAMPQFWQNFPKAIESADNVLTLRLWPRQYADLHELQGGEQKTHVFYVAAGSGELDWRTLEWCRRPARAMATPSWYCGADAVPGLTLLPEAEDPEVDRARLVRAGIDGPDSFAAKREIIDEYGWRHFGDLYADHEAALRQTPPPLVSHYNNQYDGVAGFAIQFFRTGDTRWWTAMDELASHVSDIDIYHTNGDKPAYNGGLFWHTYHYSDADRSTHRSYARSSPTDGGGPSNEHDYATGLMLHYLLTGDLRSREAVIGLGRWVLAMDDGRRTPFRWLDRGDTGLASATDNPGYHGPGRGAAYSVQTLLDAFRLTGEEAYQRKAEQLIRRCIHPADDIDARHLSDVEEHWSYTVFLQALGRYLAFKEERGERDRMHAYARESLLAYAGWMLAHEHPYLDRPEILEYPDETWMAQDMRKADVFRYAAAYAAPTIRARFLERARFFFDYAVTALLASGRADRTRPLVLMLGNGYPQQTSESVTQDRPAETAAYIFGQPEVFVPQKARVRERLAAAARLGWPVWKRAFTRAAGRRATGAGAGAATIRQRLKLGLLWGCRAAGLFALARRCTRNGLRILCYHGFSLLDEHEFRPGLFMRGETFRRRMAYLVRKGYPVLSLEEGARRLAAGTLPDNAVVITIDDGFYSVGRVAWPILKTLSLPATLYVTSYYVTKRAPVFRLAMQYFFWKTDRTRLDLSGLGPGLACLPVLSLDGTSEAEPGMWEIIRFGETQLDQPERERLAKAIAERLGVSYDALDTQRSLSLLTPAELRGLVSDGLDVQLHTHRHELPQDAALVRREIDDNRGVLEPLTRRSLHHFCYPSGVWTAAHWSSLDGCGIATATTCDPGLNGPGSPRLALTRYLDSEEMAPLEFEAEVSGFSEWIRVAQRTARRLRRRTGERQRANRGATQLCGR